MTRNVIDPEFPFTTDEIAAAWIISGLSREEALDSARATETVIRSGFSGVRFEGDFDHLLHLIADVHSDEGLLSQTGRDLRLEEWSVDIDPTKLEAILDDIAMLGNSWAARRPAVRALLTRRTA